MELVFGWKKKKKSLAFGTGTSENYHVFIHSHRMRAGWTMIKLNETLQPKLDCDDVKKVKSEGLFFFLFHSKSNEGWFRFNTSNRHAQHWWFWMRDCTQSEINYKVLPIFWSQFSWSNCLMLSTHCGKYICVFRVVYGNGLAVNRSMTTAMWWLLSSSR